ncbi:uncharacterized protein LOC143537607 [Bidens hawaiensis]|uniref:uncharacterized protein LOC143537607 n=1 Tax=Bidens hawaiensis TaxID=980011 RepID=UPI00404A0264
MDGKIHPAVTISNIKLFIPITLDNESAQYNTWWELFRIHCTVYMVDDHLKPRVVGPTPSTGDKDKGASSTNPTPDQWKRLDAIVLQWIYGTISIDLLQTVMKKQTTAYDAWIALENLFQDNKSSRALHLQTKLTNTRLDSFKDMAAYCQEVKVLADQLSDIDLPLSQTQIVLKLLGVVTEQYSTIAAIIRNTDPLPEFNSVRSTLCREETEKAAQALQSATAASHALAATSKPDPQHADSPSGNR